MKTVINILRKKLKLEKFIKVQEQKIILVKGQKNHSG